MTSRQALPFILLVFLVLAAKFAPPAHAAAIRIAYSSISGAMLPLWVAKDRKFFDKHGVDVELTYIRGVAIEAMLSGEVQFVRAAAPISRSLRIPSTSQSFP